MKILYFFLLILIVGCSSTENINITVSPSSPVKITEIQPPKEYINFDSDLVEIYATVNQDFEICWTKKSSPYTMTIGKSSLTTEVSVIDDIMDNCYKHTGLSKGIYYVKVLSGSDKLSLLLTVR